MAVRLLILALLVAIVWAFATPDIPLFRAIFSSILAAMVAAVVFISSSTLDRFVRLQHPFLIFALAAPAVCMALQFVPIPIQGLGNPIWETASAALNEPLADRITVDTRATVQAIMHYNGVVALGLVTAIVASDRQRASQVLFVLVSVATVVSAYSIWRPISGLDGYSRGENPGSLANDAVPAVLGLLLSVAVIVRALERRRRVRQSLTSALGPATRLSLALVAMLICLATILIRGEMSIAIAALLGMTIVLALFAVRKWFYGIWGKAGALATAAVLVLASFTLVPMRQNTDLTIALSRQSQVATERMLQDTGLTGSGAGTYAVLLPIHRDIGTTASRERPTAAAAIAIDMGRSFLYGLSIITVLGAGALLRRSLLRGNDYIYAAIGSGAAVSLGILALIEDGILDFGPSLLAAALFGLAFAQSQPSTASEVSHSRSPRPVNGANGQYPTSPPTGPNAFRHGSVRLGLGFVAVVLIAQSGWLLAQSHLGGFLIRLPVISGTSIQALSRTPPNPLPRDGDLRAGNLASTALSKGNEIAASRPEGGTPTAALNAFADALHYSPLRGDLWLMLAAISKEQRSTGYDLVALLKLSYYTAPNDLALLPLRLTVALSIDSAVGEPELRELIKRDVKIAFANQPALRPALIAAYQSASADGKTFADNLISELDPAYLQSMHAGIRVPVPGPEFPPNKNPEQGAAR